jgi:spermidine synthase
MLNYSFIENNTVVDTSSEIVSDVKANTTGPPQRMIAGGHRFAQSAITSGVKYDLIQNKIKVPWQAGGGDLFTRKFFANQYSLLNEGGDLTTRPLDRSREA